MSHTMALLIIDMQRDFLDPDGYISMPTAPGLGYDIVWEYIKDNLLTADRQPALVTR